MTGLFYFIFPSWFKTKSITCAYFVIVKHYRLVSSVVLYGPIVSLHPVGLKRQEANLAPHSFKQDSFNNSFI